MQHVVNLIIRSVDLAGFNATIYPAHGSSNNYAFTCEAGPVVGQSTFTIQGDTTARTAVGMVATSAVGVVKDGCTVSIDSVAAADNGSNNASTFFNAGTGNYGHIDLSNVTFGALGIGTALTASYGGSITLAGTNSLTGSESAFASVSDGGVVEIDGTVAGSAAITWGTAAVISQSGGFIAGVTPSTFTGFSGVSGPRCYFSNTSSPDGYNPNSLYPGSTDCVINVTVGAVGVQKGSGGSSTIDYGTNHWPLVSSGSASAPDKYEQLQNAGLAAGASNTIKCSTNGTSETDCTPAQVQGALEQGITLISVNTISGAASYSDTTSITSACDDYQIIFDDLIPATSNVNVEILFHSSGSFQNTNYVNQSGGATAYFDVIKNAANISNVDGASFTLTLFGVNSAVHKKSALSGSYVATTPSVVFMNGAGYWNGGTTAIDGFQVLMSSGNIASGKVKVYCLRPAM
jgi:hypothetical protein